MPKYKACATQIHLPLVPNSLDESKGTSTEQPLFSKVEKLWLPHQGCASLVSRPVPALAGTCTSRVCADPELGPCRDAGTGSD